LGFSVIITNYNDLAPLFTKPIGVFGILKITSLLYACEMRSNYSQLKINLCPNKADGYPLGKSHRRRTTYVSGVLMHSLSNSAVALGFMKLIAPLRTYLIRRLQRASNLGAEDVLECN
jgi:hypothetical protein